MTRLFLRFYVGVVLILLIAWLVQTYITRTHSGRQNASVVEDALAGGLRLARDELTEAPKELVEEKFKDIVGTFEYPVHVISMGIDWLDAPERRRLIDGETVLLGDYIAIALISRPKPDKSIADEMMLTDTVTETLTGEQDDTNAGTMIPKAFLLFGPLPQFVAPSPAEIMIGYGVIFLLAAIAIAILLRPVAKQFRDVERDCDRHQWRRLFGTNPDKFPLAESCACQCLQYDGRSHGVPVAFAAGAVSGSLS